MKINMKPYIPQLIHRLLEDDPDCRLQFCKQLINLYENKPTFLDKIVWTDEATFKLLGQINHHNCVYWSDRNPHLMITSKLNQPGITVWAGILSAGIVCPEFFERTVT